MLEDADIGDTVVAMRHDVLSGLISTYIPPGSVEEIWEIPELENSVEAETGLKLPIGQWLEDDDNLHEETLRERIFNEADTSYADKKR